MPRARSSAGPSIDRVIGHLGLLRTAGAGAGVLVVAAAIDLVARPEPPALGPLLGLRFLLVVWAMALGTLLIPGLVGSLLSLLLWRSGLTRHDEVTGWARAALRSEAAFHLSRAAVGGALAAVSWWPLLAYRRGLFFDHLVVVDRLSVLVAIPASAVAVALALALGRLRGRARAGFPTATAVGAAVGTWCLAAGPVRDVHAPALVELMFAAACVAAFVAGIGLSVGRRVAVALVLAPLVFGGAIAARADDGLRWALLTRSAPVAAGVTAWLSRLDLDGDGFVGLEGGGLDCRDLDVDVHPLAVDVPGNGLDENCTGADAHRPAPAPPAVTPAWAPTPAAAPVGEGPPDVILITVDTLSADHISAETEGGPVAPFLAAGPGAVRFEAAFSPYPRTDLAMPALLFGRYPSGFTDSLERPRDVTVPAPPLGEALAALGFDTFAVLALPAPPSHRAGFDHVEVVAEGRGVLETGVDAHQLARVLDLVTRPRAHARPRLVWAHLMGPHARYLAQPDFDRGQGERGRYRSEIAALDARLAGFIDALGGRGGLARAVVVVTADHGEQFVRGGAGHGSVLSGEVLRVPLLVWAPGARPRALAEPVSLVDVAPTVVEWAGGARLPTHHGRSLKGVVAGGDLDGDRRVYAELFFEGARRRASIGMGDVLIVDLATGARALFDWRDDPGEWTNLADDRRARADALFHEMNRFWDDVIPRGGTARALVEGARR